MKVENAVLITAAELTDGQKSGRQKHRLSGRKNVRYGPYVSRDAARELVHFLRKFPEEEERSRGKNKFNTYSKKKIMSEDSRS